VVEAARYRLGGYDRGSFEELGRALLLDGRDEGVPLLSLRDVFSERARSVFERMCASVGQAIPSFEDAAKIVITSIALDIDGRRVTPQRAIELLSEPAVWLHGRRIGGELAGGTGRAGELAGLLAVQPLVTPASRSVPPGLEGPTAESAGGWSEDDVREFARDWLAANQATVTDILATHCGMPIDRDWRELAAEKRAGENRLIERHRHDLFGDETPPAGRDIHTQQTPWGAGVQVAPEMFVTAIRRRSAWPETHMVLDLFWAAFPDRHWVVMLAVWPPAQIRDLEPRYNDVLWFNLMEWLHTRGPRRIRDQPGPVVYYIQGSRYDLHPPALGPAPAELLAARQEVDEIKRGWVKANSPTPP
jgi:hypothetical protein